MPSDMWQWLGVEPTYDERAIKRAYAAMTKIYHPEDHPEQFRQLHEAYESALRLAKDSQAQPPLSAGEPQVEAEETSTPILQESASNTIIPQQTYAFEQMIEDGLQKEYQKILRYALSLLFQENPAYQQSFPWHLYVQTPAFLQVHDDPCYQDELLRILVRRNPKPATLRPLYGAYERIDYVKEGNVVYKRNTIQGSHPLHDYLNKMKKRFFRRESWKKVGIAAAAMAVIFLLSILYGLSGQMW